MPIQRSSGWTSRLRMGTVPHSRLHSSSMGPYSRHGCYFWSTGNFSYAVFIDTVLVMCCHLNMSVWTWRTNRDSPLLDRCVLQPQQRIHLCNRPQESSTFRRFATVIVWPRRRGWHRWRRRRCRRNGFPARPVVSKEFQQRATSRWSKTESN